MEVSAVLPCETVSHLYAESITMSGLAGSTEVTVWPFPPSVGHWEATQIQPQARIREGIMELLTSDMERLCLPARLTPTMPCRPGEAFPALTRLMTSRLTSPGTKQQGGGDTTCSGQTREQHKLLTEGIRQGAREVIAPLAQSSA